MTSKHDDLEELLKNFIDSNYASAAPGMNVLVKGNNFNFEYWTGSIPELNFSYTRDTIFDMASLTKPVVTATLVMKMLEMGKIGLEDTLQTLGMYSSEFAISRLTIRDLITHTSGLIPTYPLYKYGATREDYLRTIAIMHERRLPLAEEYSDLNYILLGFVIERITGKTLDEIAQEYIFKPIGMKNSCFNPKANQDKIAPTEKDPERGGLVWGKVHDEKSYYLGGVAGHAGMFSTIDDMGKYIEALLNYKLLKKPTLEEMIQPQNASIGGMFGIGWMIKIRKPISPSVSFGYNAFMGDVAPIGTFGHTGFTGTSIAIEPSSGIFVVILSNRVFPTRENLGILRFRRLFHNMVFSNLLECH